MKIYPCTLYNRVILLMTGEIADSCNCPSLLRGVV